jgi:hypothetical protein
MQTAIAHQFGISAEQTTALRYCAEGGRVLAADAEWILRQPVDAAVTTAD